MWLSNRYWDVLEIDGILVPLKLARYFVFRTNKTGNPEIGSCGLCATSETFEKIEIKVFELKKLQI